MLRTIFMVNSRGLQTLSQDKRLLITVSTNPYILGLVNNYNPDPIEDYSFIIEDIQRKIANAQFEFSENAVNQLNSRQIELNEIIEAIANGQIIEDYPNDNDEPSYLICGLTSSGRAIHVQCSYPSSPLIKIMTVYEPDPQEWNSDFTIRRINDE